MNPINAWNRFWFSPVSARPLGAFRIVFGLVALANLAILAFDMDYWLTNAGLLHGDEAWIVSGPLRPSPLHWIQDPTSVHAFLAVTALLGVLLTVGWHTRVVSVLFFLATLAIHQRNILTNSGADCLMLLVTLYMMLAPCGAAYSLDARRAARRRGTEAEPLIVPWAQRLIQLHICLVYFDTAVLKCNGASWLNGTALHYVLYNDEVGRFHLGVLREFPLLVNLLTHGALLIEFALAFLLWFRSTRFWVICAGLALHVSILLTVNIPIFGELITACYLTFLTPVELDRLLGTLDPRRWLSRLARLCPALPGRALIPSQLGSTRLAVADAADRVCRTGAAAALSSRQSTPT
jgi:hypothetical protein